MNKSRGILFSAPMVRAILAGRKTVTRRLVKPQPKHMLVEGLAHVTIGMNPAEDGINWYDSDGINPGRLVRCPYGQTGDILWVKETFCQGRAAPIYRADCCEDRPSANTDDWNAPVVDRWRPSIHMPKSASRITLEIVSVRAERLQDITETDAIAEGVETHAQKYGVPEMKLHGTTPWYRYDGEPCSAVSAVESYRTLWESINGKGSWAANPLVWRIEFRRVTT